MHVIRHQHVRVDRAAIVLGVELQPVQIEPIILLRVEARRAVVAALEDMQRHITNPGSGAAWHARVYRFASVTPSHKSPTGLPPWTSFRHRAKLFALYYSDVPHCPAERAPLGLSVFLGSESKYL
jgi:hypothetical protein